MAPRKKETAPVIESDTIEAPETNGMAKAKRVANEKVSVKYILEDGTKVANIPADGNVHGVEASVGPQGSLGVFQTMFGDLDNKMLLAAAAFGLNTAYRNAVNTAASVEDGADALEDRHGRIHEGIWRAAGEGGETIPLVLEAVRRAKLNAGATAEEAEASYNRQLDRYRAATGADDKETEKLRAAIRKELNEIAAVKLAGAQLQQERAAKRLAKLQGTTTSGGANIDSL